MAMVTAMGPLQHIAEPRSPGGESFALHSPPPLLLLSFKVFLGRLQIF